MTVIVSMDNSSKEHEPLVGSEVICKLLGISLATLSKLTKDNSIPHYQLKRQLRFRVSEVLAALKV